MVGTSNQSVPEMAIEEWLTSIHPNPWFFVFRAETLCRETACRGCSSCQREPHRSWAYVSHFHNHPSGQRWESAVNTTPEHAMKWHVVQPIETVLSQHTYFKQFSPTRIFICISQLWVFFIAQDQGYHSSTFPSTDQRGRWIGAVASLQ